MVRVGDGAAPYSIYEEELKAIVPATWGELVYEVFMYGGDSGTAFKAGTTEVVAEIVQRRLQPHDDDAGLAIAIACEESDFREVRNFTLRDAWSWYPPQKE